MNGFLTRAGHGLGRLAVSAGYGFPGGQGVQPESAVLTICTSLASAIVLTRLNAPTARVRVRGRAC